MHVNRMRLCTHRQNELGMPLIHNKTSTALKTRRVFGCIKTHGAKAPCSFCAAVVLKRCRDLFPAFRAGTAAHLKEWAAVPAQTWHVGKRLHMNLALLNVNKMI